MSRSLLTCLALTLVVVLKCLGPAWADDATINTSFDSLAPQNFVHEDDDPWKGWAMVTVYNDTNEYWIDFHFKIFSVNGSNISATIFIDSPAQYQPTSSQSGLTWIINNDPAGAEMNLYFASDPVAPDTEAWFKVYTDNTTYRQRFGICVYPTIVPEPSSLLALSGGMLSILAFARRRRGR